MAVAEGFGKELCVLHQNPVWPRVALQSQIKNVLFQPEVICNRLFSKILTLLSEVSFSRIRVPNSR